MRPNDRPAALRAPIISAINWAERAAPPVSIARLGRGRARRAFDRRGQRRRGQLALAYQLRGTKRGQTLGPQGLLGLTPGGERHQHCARACRQQVQDGVVAGLADRNPAGAQQRREIVAEPLDHDAGRRARPQHGNIAVGQVGAGNETPGQMSQAPGAAGGERRLEQRLPGRTTARRDENFAAGTPPRSPASARLRSRSEVTGCAT